MSTCAMWLCKLQMCRDREYKNISSYLVESPKKYNLKCLQKMKNICRDICNFCSYVSRGTGCPPGDASWQNPDAWQCIEGKSSASLKMVPTAICQQQLSLYCISTVADCKSLMYSQPQEDLGPNCRKIQTFGGYTVKLIVAIYKYKNKKYKYGCAAAFAAAPPLCVYLQFTVSRRLQQLPAVCSSLQQQLDPPTQNPARSQSSKESLNPITHPTSAI